MFRKSNPIGPGALLVMLAAAPMLGQIPDSPPDRAASLQVPVAVEADSDSRLSAADRIVASSATPALADLLREVLERNPMIAAASARARAAAERAPQVAALPDPMAAITPYLMSPETRVGPQQVMLSLSERLPWFGKLRLREQAALYAAAAERADVEAKRLVLVTEARRLVFELGFLDAWEPAVRSDRATLQRYEELARTRYASGAGLEQAVIKLQAEITKDDNRLLDIRTRRATMAAALNALRDMPADAPIPDAVVPEDAFPLPDAASLRSDALANRPELAQADALIARADSEIELAKKESFPDFNVGVGYTIVGNREDAAGRMNPPPDNGNDVLGVTAGVNLPIWRKKLAAGVEEAIQRRSAAEESKRAVITSIDQALGDLTQRIPLTADQIRLFRDVLLIQAEHALDSAESAYTSGSIGALDLLDAERVLLDVRTSLARSRADYAIALARLEGVTGAVVSATTKE